MDKPNQAQQIYAHTLVKPLSQLVEHWWLYRCGDEALLCRPWGLNANRGPMLLGKLASEHCPHHKDETLSSNKGQKWAAYSNDKAEGGGERQQESKLGGYSIPWGFGLRESNCGGCPGGVLVGVQLLCLPWWRHLEWLSGLQERKLVNTTDKPLPTVTPSIRSPRVRAWLMRGSDPIRAKYYEDSPINT